MFVNERGYERDAWYYNTKFTRYMIMMHFVMKIAWDSVCKTLGIFFLQFMCQCIVQVLGVA